MINEVAVAFGAGGAVVGVAAGVAADPPQAASHSRLKTVTSAKRRMGLVSE